MLRKFVISDPGDSLFDDSFLFLHFAQQKVVIAKIFFLRHFYPTQLSDLDIFSRIGGTNPKSEFLYDGINFCFFFGDYISFLSHETYQTFSKFL